ncbi:hypothetical protein [Pseudonocardia sp. DLS-67]
MRRVFVVLAVAGALCLGLTGTGAAAPPEERLPAPPPASSVQSTWYTYGYTTTESECHAWGKELTADGAPKAYACEYHPDSGRPAWPWVLRVLD